jgi:hypothetical protein
VCPIKKNGFNRTKAHLNSAKIKSFVGQATTDASPWFAFIEPTKQCQFKLNSIVFLEDLPGDDHTHDFRGAFGNHAATLIDEPFRQRQIESQADAAVNL